MQPNDVILFYAMRPVAGVIGYGTIKTKFRQTHPLWPEEIANGEVIWPLRFEISVGYCAPPARWEAEKISSELLRFRAGLCRHRQGPDARSIWAGSVQQPLDSDTSKVSNWRHDGCDVKGFARKNGSGARSSSAGRAIPHPARGAPRGLSNSSKPGDRPGMGGNHGGGSGR